MDWVTPEWLRFGPPGFLALILVVAMSTLALKPELSRDWTLRVIVGVGLFAFLVTLAMGFLTPIPQNKSEGYLIFGYKNQDSQKWDEQFLSGAKGDDPSLNDALVAKRPMQLMDHGFPLRTSDIEAFLGQPASSGDVVSQGEVLTVTSVSPINDTVFWVRVRRSGATSNSAAASSAAY